MGRVLALIGMIWTAVAMASAPAGAWSAEGHRTVAAIAYALLPPATRAAVDTLTQAGTGRDFVGAATYADDHIRDETRAFDEWHFVNWAVERAQYQPSMCGSGCIVSQLPV